MKYLVSVGIFLVVIMIAIVLLMSRTPRREDRQEVRTMQATDYLNDTSKMIYTLQGPVVGDDARRSVRITIDSDSRTIEQIDGYQGKVVKSQSFTNNKEAYSYFLASLDKVGYTDERRTRNPDSQGACSRGQTYLFQITDSTQLMMDRWSASCSGMGTYGGNTANTRILFENQITTYNQFVSDIDL